MPELPEVETVRRSLLAHLVGRRIEDVRVRHPHLRWPLAIAELNRARGRRVLNLRRRAKYLLVDLSGEQVLMVHLGMSGQLGIMPSSYPLRPHEHLVWTLDAGLHLRFHDPRRFGWVELYPRDRECEHPRLQHLGCEPLGPEFDGLELYRLTRQRRRPIKSLLMDAAMVVGIGNIYACEALFRAGIRPQKAAASLSRRRAQRLAVAIRDTLTDAIEQGGTTLRDFASADGRAGYFTINLAVYGRAGDACPRCGASVRKVVLSGRSTFYCPRCQR